MFNNAAPPDGTSFTTVEKSRDLPEVVRMRLVDRAEPHSAKMREKERFTLVHSISIEMGVRLTNAHLSLGKKTHILVGIELLLRHRPILVLNKPR